MSVWYGSETPSESRPARKAKVQPEKVVTTHIESSVGTSVQGAQITEKDYETYLAALGLRSVREVRNQTDEFRREMRSERVPAKKSNLPVVLTDDDRVALAKTEIDKRRNAPERLCSSCKWKNHNNCINPVIVASTPYYTTLKEARKDSLPTNGCASYCGPNGIFYESTRNPLFYLKNRIRRIYVFFWKMINAY